MGCPPVTKARPESRCSARLLSAQTSKVGGSLARGDLMIGEAADRKRPGTHDYFMGIAIAVRRRADCIGNRVGAVIVLDRRIVSTGYNGTPENMPNCSEGGCHRCAHRDQYPLGYWLRPVHLRSCRTERLARSRSIWNCGGRRGCLLDNASLLWVHEGTASGQDQRCLLPPRLVAS